MERIEISTFGMNKITIEEYEKIVKEGKPPEETLSVLEAMVRNTGVRIPDNISNRLVSYVLSHNSILFADESRAEKIERLEAIVSDTKRIIEYDEESFRYGVQNAYSGIIELGSRFTGLLFYDTYTIGPSDLYRKRILSDVEKVRELTSKSKVFNVEEETVREGYGKVTYVNITLSKDKEKRRKVAENLAKYFNIYIGILRQVTGVDLSDKTVRRAYDGLILSEKTGESGEKIYNILEDPVYFIDMVYRITGKTIPSETVKKIYTQTWPFTIKGENISLMRYNPRYAYGILPDYLRREHGVEIEFTRKN